MEGWVSGKEEDEKGQGQQRGKKKLKRTYGAPLSLRLFRWPSSSVRSCHDVRSKSEM